LNPHPRILFLIPRYHTNMVGWVECLLSQNIEVKIIATRREFSENHSRLEPAILPTGICKVMRFIPLSKALKVKLTSPKLSIISQEVKQVEASRIVIRFELDLVSLKYLLVARLQGVPVFIYTQWPVINTPIFKKLILIFFVKFLKLPAFSPVYDYGHTKLDFNSIEKAYKVEFDLDMKRKQSESKLSHWIPFTLSESFTQTKEKSLGEDNESTVHFTTIGKFVQRKNLLMIVEVFCKNQMFMKSDSVLTIIGECTTEEHKSMQQELSRALENHVTSGKVKILTNLSHEEVRNILVKSQVFLLQSSKEPASISILEAMGNGNVLILDPASGTASYAGENYGSLAASSQDELSWCIDKVLMDSAFVAKLQGRSLQIFEEHFSNRVVGRHLYDFLFQKMH
jgi:glycosyltransferase involved in cell wall biosynthesis